MSFIKSPTKIPQPLLIQTPPERQRHRSHGHAKSPKFTQPRFTYDGVSTTPRGPPPPHLLSYAPANLQNPQFQSPKTKYSRVPVPYSYASQQLPQQQQQAPLSAAFARQFPQATIESIYPEFMMQAPPPPLSFPVPGPANQGFATNLNNAAGQFPTPNPWGGMQSAPNFTQIAPNYPGPDNEARQRLLSSRFACNQTAPGYAWGQPPRPSYSQFPAPMSQADIALVQQYNLLQSLSRSNIPARTPNPPSGPVSLKSLLPLARRLKQLHADRRQHQVDSDRTYNSLSETLSRLQADSQKFPGDELIVEKKWALKMDMEKMAITALRKDQQLEEEIDKLKEEVGRIEAFLEGVLKGSRFLEEGNKEGVSL